MKTIPFPDEFQWDVQAYAERAKNWQRPEADRFGTWYDWSDVDVAYLLEELRAGHWDDCGDMVRGFALAEAGLGIAQIADEESNGNDKLGRVLEAVGQGLDWMLAHHGAQEHGSSRATVKAARRILKQIKQLRAIESGRLREQAAAMDDRATHATPPQVQ